MDLAAKSSALLRSKLVMRLSCVLVAVGFLVSSVVTPRARAVAVVDDVAVGAMSCAAFLESIGLPLSATGGAGAVSGGITAVAGEYAAATGAAASGEAFLGTVAAGTAISTAGTIILTAAVVAACAAFAHWLYTEYALDSHTESVPVYSYTDDKETIEINIDGYPPFSFQYTDIGGTGYLSSSSYFTNQKVGSYSVQRFPVKPIIYDFKEWPIINNKHSFCYATAHYTSSGEFIDTPSYATVEVRDNYSLSNPHGGFAGVGTALNTTGSSRGGFFTYEGLTWLRSGSSLMLCEVSSYNSCYYIGNFFGTLTNYFTRYVFDSTYYAKKLSIAATPTYSIPEIQPNQSMEITIPSAAPGSTLAELAETVPQQVADGTLSATYTIDTAAPTPPPISDGDVEDVDELGLPSLGEALTRRFPFSIPWDIARGITLLAAPAKTPYFEVDFYAPISDLVGGWQGSTKLVLDFSQFESLGRLSRWTSTIGFCLFLASATKRFIWTA